MRAQGSAGMLCASRAATWCEHTCEHLQHLSYMLLTTNLPWHTGLPDCEDRKAMQEHQAPRSDNWHPAQRTGVVHAQPPVDTARMVDVPAFGQLSDPLPPGKALQAN